MVLSNDFQDNMNPEYGDSALFRFKSTQTPPCRRGIGFSAALGKRCYGLRTDFRNSGDFEGIPLNLQVLYSIESSGGSLLRRINEISF